MITTGIFTKITPGFVRVVKHDSERHTLPYIVKYSKGKKKSGIKMIFFRSK